MNRAAHAGSQADQSAPGWSAAELAEALDGSERKLLLARIADTDPDTVLAAAAWLTAYHAENAERRRAARNRKATLRDRARRAGAVRDTQAGPWVGSQVGRA